MVYPTLWNLYFEIGRLHRRFDSKDNAICGLGYGGHGRSPLRGLGESHRLPQYLTSQGSESRIAQEASRYSVLS